MSAHAGDSIKKLKSNKKNKVKPTIGFPKLNKKKKQTNGKPQILTITHQMEHKNCNKDKYLNNFTIFDHITDEKNVITPSI